MPLLAPEGWFDVTMKNRFAPISAGSKSRRSDDYADWRSQEAEWATLNGCKYITLHVIQLSACQGESGLLRCVSPGVSHPFFYLAAVFPVTKINIWASAVPEGLIFLPSLTAAPCFTFRRLLTLRTWSSSEQPLEHLRLCSCHFETAVSGVCFLHNQFELLQNVFLSILQYRKLLKLSIISLLCNT